MRTTYRQPPNMKGKKTFLFRCGCCSARNCLELERERIALKEAAEEAVEVAKRNGARIHPRVSALRQGHFG